jgi:hypothetical protein
VFNLWGFAQKYPALANQAGAGNLMIYPWDASGTKTAVYTAMLNALSGVQYDLIPPSTPTNVVATGVSQTQINLIWTPSTDNVGVTGYRIFRNSVQVGTSAAQGA